MIESEQARLKSRIREAFESVPMPSKEDVFEEHGKHFDEGQIRKYFAGKPVEELDLRRSGYTAEHLLHMSPDCAHYYIQAYLSQYLDPDVPADDTDIAALAGLLSGPSRYSPKFTSEQIEVVLAVLRFFEDNKDSYWLSDHDLAR